LHIQSFHQSRMAVKAKSSLQSLSATPNRLLFHEPRKIPGNSEPMRAWWLLLNACLLFIQS
jgi:hypothetical protein